MSRGPLPLAVPRLSRDAARRANALAAANGVFTFKIGAASAAARLRKADASVAVDWRLEFRLGNAPLLAGCTHKTLAFLLRMIEPGLLLEPTPSSTVLALLLDTLLHPWLRATQQHLGRPVLFYSIEPAATFVSNEATLALTLGETAHVVALAGEALDHLLTAWPSDPRPLSKLLLPCAVRLGWTELPADIVATLLPGDAVIIQSYQPQMLRLSVGATWSAPAEQKDSTIVLLDQLRPQGNERHPMSTKKGHNVDLMPVRLEFDVGQQDITLAELKTLQAGSVLSLGRSLKELVEIRINGRQVGTGEMVDVDGVAAIQVSRLFDLG